MSTVSVDNQEVLRGILANSKALFLDFDGPVCDLFAGFGDQTVADRLRDVLGGDQLPEHIAQTADPFEVFGYAATLGNSTASKVEAALAESEVEAIETAPPTPGAHELMAAWQFAGLPLAIVSNNSVAAVRAYLERHELQPYVTVVSGRSSADPAELKPAPYLLAEAARTLALSLSHCTIIGDSRDDVVAGIRAASSTIGFAAESEVAAELAESYPDAITTSMNALIPIVNRVSNGRRSG